MGHEIDRHFGGGIQGDRDHVECVKSDAHMVALRAGDLGVELAVEVLGHKGVFSFFEIGSLEGCIFYEVLSFGVVILNFDVWLPEHEVEVLMEVVHEVLEEFLGVLLIVASELT